MTDFNCLRPFSNLAISSEAFDELDGTSPSSKASSSRASEPVKKKIIQSHLSKMYVRKMAVGKVPFNLKVVEERKRKVKCEKSNECVREREGGRESSYLSDFSCSENLFKMARKSVGSPRGLCDKSSSVKLTKFSVKKMKRRLRRKERRREEWESCQFFRGLNNRNNRRG